MNQAARLWKNPRVAIIAGGALIAVIAISVVAFVLTRSGSTAPLKLQEPSGFSVTPSGQDAPRLAPVRVTFAKPPKERDGKKVLQIDPQPKGSYTWVSERTLLFQPDYPGYTRGQTYNLKVAAQPDADLAADYKASFLAEGLLSIQSVIPAPDDVEVPTNGQILVQFSRAVAPLTLISSQPDKQVISFDPPLKGKGEWLNTSLYRFIPEAMSASTTFKAKIAANLASTTDGSLKEDYSWSFTTFSPAVSQVTPDNNTLFGAPRQPVVVTFNQPMDRASVQGLFGLFGPNKTLVAGTGVWSENDTVYTFTPDANLGPKTAYTVNVPLGVKGTTGGTSKIAWNSSFTSVGAPGIERTNPIANSTNASTYGVSITFTNPMDADSLAGKISISPSASTDPLTQSWYDTDRTTSVNAPLKPSSPYTVTIAAGGKDRYGQPLPASSFSFTTGQLPASVSFATPGQLGTYSASVEPLLYFHATNTPSVPFTLYTLTTGEMERLLAINGFPKDFFPTQPPSRKWTQTVAVDRDVVGIASTSLSGGGVLPKGDYYVTSGSPGFNSVFAFSVVDTAIVTKVSTDELLNWVLDLDTGQPVAGVKVTPSGTGLTNVTGTTDANGLVSFKLPAAAGNSRDSYVVKVDDGGRRGMTTTHWTQGSEPYNQQLPVDFGQRTYVSHLYTDRPIYRPGEEVFWKGIVRTDDDATYAVPPPGTTFNVVLRDPQGKELTRQPATLNEFGSLTGSFTLPADVPTGFFFLAVQSPNVTANPPQGFGPFIANASFQVAEFKKPEYAVAEEADKTGYANGDSISVKTTASFYFGGGVNGAKVEWSVLAFPTGFRPKEFTNYSFVDFDSARTSVSRDALRSKGTSTTDAQGVAQFSVPATINGDEGTQSYTIATNVIDQNGQAVGSSLDVLVHPADRYAGIRPVQYLAAAGSEAKFDLVSVDLDGKPVANANISVKVYDRKWVTTKVATADGARRYQSNPVDTLLSTIPVMTDGKGLAQASYTPKSTGQLRVTAETTDAKGRTSRSATYLWVSGSEFASWRVTNDDTFALIADKDSYEVGDTAKVLVPAPYADAIGLLTVERGKVQTKEVRQFATDHETLSIPVGDKSVPDVFVTTVLYRPPTTIDPIPRYKVGYVQLPVSTKTRQLTVEIKPDHEQAKPGDKVKYAIKVTDSNGKGIRSELSLAVVDKAVLALASETGPNGLRAFWFQRGLGVATSSSLSVSVNRTNDIISEPRQGGKGGDGSDLNQLRQDFRNTAFWQGQVTTDANGATTVEVGMPDNLTTWRMQARAISGDVLVGEATNELVSTQPLLIRPALPRFLRVGDNVTIRTLVRNNTGKNADVSVTLSALGIDATGGAKTQQVKAGESGTFDWPAKVTDPGTAKVTFSASGGGEKDGVSLEIPIQPSLTLETTATNGVVTDTPSVEGIYLPPFAEPKNATISLSVQASLAGSLAAELDALRPPKQGFRESSPEIASRIIATMGVGRSDASKTGGTAKVSAQTQSDVATLLGRQRSDGGFAWCSDFCGTDPLVTGWVLYALGEAKTDGAQVDPAVVTKSTSYLTSYVNRQVDLTKPADASEKAFLYFALTEAGAPLMPQMRALVEQYRSQLTNSGKAYLIMGLTRAGVAASDPIVTQLLNDLSAQIIPSATGNHWEDQIGKDSYRNFPAVALRSTQATAVVLDALVRVQPGHPLIEETVRWLMSARTADGWTTSPDRAQAILALSEFAAKTGELAGDFTYEATLGGDSLLKGAFKPGDGATSNQKTQSLASTSAGSVTPLSISKLAGSPGRLYYTLALRYRTPAAEVEAVNRGFAIAHRYSLLDDASKPITSAKLGDVVRVTVTVTAPADQLYVVVDDALPAGLEPIDPRLKTTDPKLVAQLAAEQAKSNRPKTGDYAAPWFRWYFTPFQQADIRDDRVTLRTSRLPKGVHEYTYYARATSVGDFFAAPPRVEESYFPEVFGRGDSGRFVVGN